MADPRMVRLSVDGVPLEAHVGSRLIDVLIAAKVEIPHVCYLPVLGPIQTCDTCIVSVNQSLVRACATTIASDMQVVTHGPDLSLRQTEAMQRILANHRLYCTVCDNNNGDCVVHNTMELLKLEHQSIPYNPKPYPPTDDSNPFYRYDVNQCILCGRCVEACQNLEVNETLSIDWSLPRPRVIWDDHQAIADSSCVSCGHCVSVCPCNALMEKSMIGEAGFLTGQQNKDFSTNQGGIEGVVKADQRVKQKCQDDRGDEAEEDFSSRHQDKCCGQHDAGQSAQGSGKAAAHCRQKVGF